MTHFKALNQQIGTHLSRVRLRAPLIVSVVANGSAAAVSMVTSFVVYPLYLTSVGASAFSVTIIMQALTTVCTNTDLGGSASALRRVASARPRFVFDDPILRWVLRRQGRVAVLSCVVFFIGSLITHSPSRIGSGPNLLGVVFGALLPVGLRPFQAYYQGHLRYVVERIFIVVAAALRLTMALLISEGYLTTGRLYLLVIAELSTFWLPAIGCCTLAALAYARRNVRGHAHGQSLADNADKFSSNDYHRFARHAFTASLLSTLILYIDSVLVGAVLKPHDVIIFAVANRFVQTLRQVSQLAMEPIVAQATRTFSEQGLPRLQSLLLKLTPLAVTAFAVCGVALNLVSHLLIPHLLPNSSTDDRRSAAICTMLLIAALIISSAHQLSQTFALAAGSPAAALTVQIVWATAKDSLMLVGGGLRSVLFVTAAAPLSAIAVEPFIIRRLAITLKLDPVTMLKRSVPPVIAGLAGLAISALVIFT